MRRPSRETLSRMHRPGRWIVSAHIGYFPRKPGFILAGTPGDSAAPTAPRPEACHGPDDRRTLDREDRPRADASGEFKRPEAVFRDRIATGGRFPPGTGRYHLYAALSCPWAHRALTSAG